MHNITIIPNGFAHGYVQCNSSIYIYIYILYAARDPAALVLAAGSLKSGLNTESSLACFGLAWWFLKEGRPLFIFCFELSGPGPGPKLGT